MSKHGAGWQLGYVAAGLLLIATEIAAQGVGTSAIRGTVRTENNLPVEAVVTARNLSTGAVVKARVHDGHYVVQGLEIGGPYVVEARNLGFVPQRSAPTMLTLGDALEVDFVMRRVAHDLDTMVVVTNQSDVVRGGGGTATTIRDDMMHSLPTLNRNVFDFLTLAPQLSTKVGGGRTGLTAAGANIRFNNFLINGVDERLVNGNVSSGINGGKSIPIDAVKEYQVLTAPYDVRYGDFTGALVNTVTRSGTNELRGSAFTYWRSNQLARGGEGTSSEPYKRLQSGFSIGGPLRRNRLHFFIAPEFQRLTSPAPGPYFGQTASAPRQLRVSPSDVARFEDLMKTYHLVAGSPGAVKNSTDLVNLFARLDASIPEWNSRVVAFTSNGYSDDYRFTRSKADSFYMSNYRYSTTSRVHLMSLQVYTDLPGVPGGHNELIVSRITDGQDFQPPVKQPLVRVVVPAIDGGVVTLVSGTAESAQGRFTDNRSVNVRNEFSLSIGNASQVTVGVQAENFRVQRVGVSGGYGVWTFANLDSLARGIPEEYELKKDLSGADAPFKGWQYAAYIGDQWSLSPDFQLSGGVRADALSFSNRPSYNNAIDSIFDRRTDRMPDARVHWSPRVGFTWDVSRGSRLRGGIGMFTGRPPKAWYASALTSNGIKTGVLRCGSFARDKGAVPLFVPDFRAAPDRCKTGQRLEALPLGDVDLLDSRLHLAQTLRSSLAFNYRTSHDLSVTAEAMVSRNRADFGFVNLNLTGPQGTDRFGRVMYGTIGASGVAVPATRSDFSEVIDLTNISQNYSYELSAQVEQRFGRNSFASAAYTWSRVRDVQSPSRVNSTGLQMWGDARATSGSHDDRTPGISLNDRPHRFVAAVTYTLPWGGGSTGLSLYYLAESGVPFTYLAFGAGGRGDLNADGSNINDPVYVPRDAFDEREIIFDGVSGESGSDNSDAAQLTRVTAQQIALEQLINSSRCLRRQRGRILERNSCREPASHTTIAGARHSFRVGGHEFEADLDLFNVLNLLNSKWGLSRVSNPRLLEHVEQTLGSTQGAQSVFRLNELGTEWTLAPESAFQLQLGIRYRF